jgi:hypothetical protein
LLRSSRIRPLTIRDCCAQSEIWRDKNNKKRVENFMIKVWAFRTLSFWKKKVNNIF